MDADECQWGLNFASHSTLAKPAARQAGPLKYTLPPSDQQSITENSCCAIPIMFARGQ